ncbi:MAG TPA: DEAD/DEAH box helicase [Acidiferrobacterales bacterium]|nr:DEAD/DEAH box helicase [Acidiferrobacterales bacterium]
MLPFTETDLRRQFTPGSFHRGEDYWGTGQVKDMDCSPDGRHINGHVYGTAKKPYRVKIEIVPGRHGRPGILGHCTCPITHNCKHVVAVLLEALDLDEEEALDDAPPHNALPSPPPADPALQFWLANLTPAQDPAPVTERLLYLLDQGHYGPRPVTQVRLAFTRIRKDGSNGKPQLLHHGASSQARYVTEEDRRLLRWLDGARAQNFAGAGHYTLVGSEAGEMLGHMLTTGRCHWKDGATTPLARGELRRAEPAWRLGSDGTQRLEWNIEGDGTLLPLSAPWYVDLAAHCCGPLLTTLDATLQAALVSAPPVPPAQVATVRAALTKFLPADSPLLPRALDEAPLRHMAPTPQLRLLQTSLPLASHFQWRMGATRMDTELARIAFDYDGTTASPGEARELLTRVEGGTLTRIARDFKAEKKALRTLGEWGFVPLQSVGVFSNLPKECAHDWIVGADDRANALIDFGIRGVPALRAAGWRVEIDASYPYRIAEPDAEWYGDIDEGTGIDWFGVELGVTIDGERVNLLPVLLAWLNDARLTRANLAELDDDVNAIARLPDGRLLPMPIARVRALLGVLIELYREKPLDAHGRLKLTRVQAAQLGDIEGTVGQLAWHGGEKLRELGRRLRDFQGIRPVPAPAGLKAELRAYQQDGLNWLQFLREYELGGVLADDMGLGKTVQALAYLLAEKEAGRLDKPALVVAPTSLMVNWRREAERFAPGLKTLTLHGAARHQAFARLADYDVVFTTYPLLPRDAEALLAQEYHTVILDEAQTIKNPKAKSTEIARALTTRHRLCLTGTPMENHLGELWSLFHFLMPGLLGDERQFRRLFRTPIEKHADPERRTALARRVAPFLLRRTKEQVATELPPKTEIVRPVEIDGVQRDLYESIRLAMHDKVRREIEKKGLARSQIVILDALLKLRQVCCDPRLLKLDSAKKVKHSAKLELLMDMLPELIEEGRRVLLFSQFTSMLALIEAELKTRDIPYVLLTGDTKDRATPIDRFQSGAVPLFLISLKAGGTGLNLTAADTVIHYDPWWNPAVERQATDRAHRIGQDKAVFVYKLITQGTVEEKIAAMQARKQALADGVFGKANADTPALAAEDLEILFSPLE